MAKKLSPEVQLKRDLAKGAVRTLRRVLKIFGPKGEHWCKHEDHKVEKGVHCYCIRGAIDKTGGTGPTPIHYMATFKYLRNNLTKPQGTDAYSAAIFYNDDQGTSFRNIKAWVNRALKDALKDTKATA